MEAEKRSQSCRTTLSYEYHLTTVDGASEQIEIPDLSALPAVVIAEALRSREYRVRQTQWRRRGVAQIHLGTALQQFFAFLALVLLKCK